MLLLHLISKHLKSDLSLSSIIFISNNNIDINAEALSVRKRKAGSPDPEKHPKSITQGSQGLSLEKEEVPFDYSFNRTVSPLTVNLNRFCFSADMDKAEN